MGLMYCLYTRVMSSWGTPNAVLVSVRRTLKRVLILLMILSRCVLNDIPLPYVTSSVVVMLGLGMGMLLGALAGCVLFSWDQGAIRLSVDFNFDTKPCSFNQQEVKNVGLYFLTKETQNGGVCFQSIKVP